jgi:hypothetical protein
MNWLVLLVVVAVLLVAWTKEIHANDSCALFLAPSKVPGAGRGVFAGKNFDANEFLEQDPSITILYHHSSLTSLAHYVYSCDDDNYSMVNFGAGCLFNYVPSRVSVEHFWADDAIISSGPGTLPYANTTHVYFQSSQASLIGQEMYVSYGESWFEEREIFQQVDVDPQFDPDLFSYTEAELKEKGICLSNVMIASSTIHIANMGLHAFKPFSKGELITISPVLILPMKVVEETINSSVLMNYVWTEPGARVGLFPLSHLAMINHASPASDWMDGLQDSENAQNDDLLAQMHANVEVRWFDLREYPSHKHEPSYRYTPDELQNTFERMVDTPYAPLEIALYATRDIALGDELFVDYGDAWQHAWQNWLYDVQDASSLFRHPIHLPKGMLPEQWFHTTTNSSTVEEHMRAIRTDHPIADSKAALSEQDSTFHKSEL